MCRILRTLIFTFATAVLLLQSACTTLSEGSFQVIRVESPSPGLKVVVDGKQKGVTPGYFEVRRGHSPKIFVGDREIPVATSYRWSRSFWSGLVFFAYAPIAWLTDLGTGTAWDLDDVRVGGANVDSANMRDANRAPPVIAIAPPRADSAEISDNAGSRLYEKLKETLGGSQVLNYRATLPKFLENDYVFDIHSSDRGQSRRLYRELGADRIYESTVTEENDQLFLMANELNVVTGEKKAGPKILLSDAEISRKIPGTSVTIGTAWWSRLLPNTLGIDVVDERLQIELASTGLVYELRPVNTEDWWATGLRYISSINISNTPDRRREFGSKWIFSAVPALRVSRRNVKATDLPIPSGSFVERDPEFTRWIVSGGYGLQIGYLSGRHYVYLDLIPTFSWNQVSWRQNSMFQSATRTAMGSQTEFGYTYIWGSDWLLKLFSRSQLEVTEVWKDALSARMGSTQYPVSASTILSGFTIAYQFDTY
ncbi:MAG: hypothetical protein U1E10_01185, partial [Bdellovibrionales bacterium]|nr:hypothetical protein [Bdellovibrionales bacterium]